MKIVLTSASLSSSGKQQFPKEKFMILVIVDFSISEGVSPTGVALDSSGFKMISRTKPSSTGRNDIIIIIIIIIIMIIII